MNFGEAVEQMRQGAKCRRAGWNGKNMWVAYMPPFKIEKSAINDRLARLVGRDEDVLCNGYFSMWTADQKLQPGWLASQTDMLAEDWEVIS